MIFLTKLLLNSLRGLDPLIFLAPICLGLSACFVTLLVELEKSRARWRDNAKKRRFLTRQPRAVTSHRPPDRLT
jgi:hypothetical protein